MESWSVQSGQGSELIKAPEQQDRRNNAKEIAKNRNLKNWIGATQHSDKYPHQIKCKNTKQQNGNRRYQISWHYGTIKQKARVHASADLCVWIS